LFKTSLEIDANPIVLPDLLTSTPGSAHTQV
jgi:hypothetical protein